MAQAMHRSMPSSGPTCQRPAAGALAAALVVLALWAPPADATVVTNTRGGVEVGAHGQAVHVHAEVQGPSHSSWEEAAGASLHQRMPLMRDEKTGATGALLHQRGSVPQRHQAEDLSASLLATEEGDRISMSAEAAAAAADIVVQTPAPDDFSPGYAIGGFVVLLLIGGGAAFVVINSKPKANQEREEGEEGAKKGGPAKGGARSGTPGQAKGGAAAKGVEAAKGGAGKGTGALGKGPAPAAHGAAPAAHAAKAAPAAAKAAAKGGAKGAAAPAGAAAKAEAKGPAKPPKPDPNELWNRFDDDKSGSLDTAEVEKMLVNLFAEYKPDATLSPEFVKRAVEVLDKDKNHKVAKEEFIAMYDEFFEMTLAVPADLPPRKLEPKQKFVLFVDSIQGTGMPSVNTFGGCDPLVEVRILKADPGGSNRNGVDAPVLAGTFCQTEAKKGETAPIWEKRLEVKDCHNGEKTHVQFILFDWNISGNTPLGDVVMPLDKALEGLTFAAKKELPKTAHKLTFSNMIEPGAKELKGTVVDCKIYYADLLSYKLVIHKGSRLPKVDTFGTCDGFIEARVVSGDPKKGDFAWTPGENCVWSAKTKVVNNDMDPKWDESFNFEVAGDPDYKLELILWDSNAPLADVPICHAIMDLKEVCALAPGSAAVTHILKFSKLPNVDPPADFKKTTVKFSISHDIVRAKD